MRRSSSPAAPERQRLARCKSSQYDDKRAKEGRRQRRPPPMIKAKLHSMSICQKAFPLESFDLSPAKHQHDAHANKYQHWNEYAYLSRKDRVQGDHYQCRSGQKVMRPVLRQAGQDYYGDCDPEHISANAKYFNHIHRDMDGDINQVPDNERDR